VIFIERFEEEIEASAVVGNCLEEVTLANTTLTRVSNVLSLSRRLAPVVLANFTAFPGASDPLREAIGHELDKSKGLPRRKNKRLKVVDLILEEERPLEEPFPPDEIPEEDKGWGDQLSDCFSDVNQCTPGIWAIAKGLLVAAVLLALLSLIILRNKEEKPCGKACARTSGNHSDDEFTALVHDNVRKQDIHSTERKWHPQLWAPQLAAECCGCDSVLDLDDSTPPGFFKDTDRSGFSTMKLDTATPFPRRSLPMAGSIREGSGGKNYQALTPELNRGDKHPRALEEAITMAEPQEREVPRSKSPHLRAAATGPPPPPTLSSKGTFEIVRGRFGSSPSASTSSPSVPTLAGPRQPLPTSSLQQNVRSFPEQQHHQHQHPHQHQHFHDPPPRARSFSPSHSLSPSPILHAGNSTASSEPLNQMSGQRPPPTASSSSSSQFFAERPSTTALPPLPKLSLQGTPPSPQVHHASRLNGRSEPPLPAGGRPGSNLGHKENFDSGGFVNFERASSSASVPPPRALQQQQQQQQPHSQDLIPDLQQLRQQRDERPLSTQTKRTKTTSPAPRAIAFDF